MFKIFPFRFIISGLILFFFAPGGWAQDSIPKSDLAGSGKIRIKAGERIDFIFTRGILLKGNLPDSFPMDASRSGSYTFGIGVGIPIGKSLALRFEPRAAWHNVFYRAQPQKTYPSPGDSLYSFEKERAFYFEMPIGFKFNLLRNEKEKVRFYLEFGAQGGYLLSSVYKRKSELDGIGYIEKFRKVGDLNKFRYGAYARIGTKIFAAQVFYRISEVFNSDAIGKPNFNNLEVGFAVVF